MENGDQHVRQPFQKVSSRRLSLPDHLPGKLNVHSRAGCQSADPLATHQLNFQLQAALPHRVPVHVIGA